MPILHAIILGIVQGLTEFLPVSSSGHLIGVPHVLGWEELAADVKRSFDVALHVGTFVGALAYFRADLSRLLRAGLRSIGSRSVQTADERLAWLLLLSSIPAAIAGAALDSFVEDSLSPIWLIGVMLIVFGAVLLVADRLQGRRDIEGFGIRDAALMGLAQACALQPGVSRSGATISMGRWLGFDREAATRISFLMSLPIIGGAGIYKGLDMASEGGIPDGMEAAFAWGMLAAGITGFFAVWGLLRLLKTRTFTPFVVYRVAAGLVLLASA